MQHPRNGVFRRTPVKETPYYSQNTTKYGLNTTKHRGTLTSSGSINNSTLKTSPDKEVSTYFTMQDTEAGG
jgi:hypothetical protein